MPSYAIFYSTNRIIRPNHTKLPKIFTVVVSTKITLDICIDRRVQVSEWLLNFMKVKRH